MDAVQSGYTAVHIQTRDLIVVANAGDSRVVLGTASDDDAVTPSSSSSDEAQPATLPPLPLPAADHAPRDCPPPAEHAHDPPPSRFPPPRITRTTPAAAIPSLRARESPAQPTATLKPPSSLLGAGMAKSCGEYTVEVASSSSSPIPASASPSAVKKPASSSRR
uniref:Uncharacterized protein n=1 Tax=Zea mays TaxID=4577 RepID=A0A804N7G4_MAIZE